jgi:hypothetical protein
VKEISESARGATSLDRLLREQNLDACFICTPAKVIMKLQLE